MNNDAQTIMISALQHYAYCPLQFALIHIERVWSDNYFTAHGNLLHERVDSCEPEPRGNVRFERSVAVKSEQLNINGKLDLLEIEGKPPTQAKTCLDYGMRVQNSVFECEVTPAQYVSLKDELMDIFYP